MNPDSLPFRMTALAVVVACLFGALFVRLWYLQVLDSNQFQVAAQQNGVRLVYTPAPRGHILDRNGKVLVDNQLINVITVDRPTVDKNPGEIERLAALLDESGEAVKLAIANDHYTDLAPVPIVTNPTAGQITYVKEHAEDFPGVDVAQQVQRLYPYGSLAAHLLGYVGEINASELAGRKGQGYKQGDEIGKAGVELAYESELRGTPGVIKYEVNSQGQVIGRIGTQQPVPGHDIRLSIDLNIQTIAENSLLQGLQVARATVDRDKGSAFAGQTYPAPAGAVVVQDPQNGQILALASQPTYNPSEFVPVISQANYDALNSPSAHDPFEDRATSGLYAPGSTFKLVTATAAIDHRLITPTTPYDDQGFIKVGGQLFRNDGGLGYGDVDLQQALTVSDDSYFYNLGAEFWESGKSLGLQDTAHLYGFGAATGIPIGGESSGVVPDPTTRRKEKEEFPTLYETGTWYTGDNILLAIGQGELVVTPLQLSNAYATFANGGTLYQPQVAIAVEGQGAQPAQPVLPKPVRQVLVPADARAAMLAGFEGVVNSGDGTAHGAFAGWPFATIPVAGKTGTAQVQNKEPTSVFTCWAPADNPKYEVTVFEEQAGYGASAAAAVARRILAGIYGMPLPAPVYIGNAAVN